LRVGVDSYDKDARHIYIAALWGFGGGKHEDQKPAPLPKPRAIPAAVLPVDLESKPKETKVERACRVLSGVIGNVNFATNSAELLPEARIVLDGLIELIRELDSEITVHAHTDDVGSDNFNFDLSARRAQSVREYLVQRGIGKSRIKALGHGESQPIAQNITPEGRARNRRVEMSTNAEVCK
jgi:outer membrane protein OmpA-like peptidoglycan-associated protein